MVEALLAAAVEARRHAYAPYSKFAVGAALRAGSGRVYTGCNVENASFSHTCCAERVAVFSAIAAGETRFDLAVVVTDTTPPASPCGACRQVLWEFGPDATVVFANLAGDRVERPLRALLPEGFDPAVLLGR
jgi:cytidine deaminase